MQLYNQSIRREYTHAIKLTSDFIASIWQQFQFWDSRLLVYHINNEKKTTTILGGEQLW